jgi:hypothetical protein
MDLAAHLRHQAERCLRLARMVGDDDAAARLNVLAAEYLAEAQALELQTSTEAPVAQQPVQQQQQQVQPKDKKGD